MKQTLIALISFGLIVSACDQPKTENPTNAVEVAQRHNEGKFTGTDMEFDARFLAEAAEINLEEIELGRLAMEKCMTPEVKALGKMMVDEHSKAFEELRELAKKKLITIPTVLAGEGKRKYEELNGKMDKEFDVEYAKMMVKGHEDAIAKFDKASKEATDSEVRAWAQSQLAPLRIHLDHALAAKSKVDQVKKES